MQRAGWWLAGAFVTVVPMLVQGHWLKGETYFFADDFGNFAAARTRGLSLDFLTTNYNPWNTPGVHLAPGHRLLDWLITVVADNRYGAAIVVMVVCIGVTAALMLGALNDLLGRRVWHYPIVFIFGVSYPLLISASWFAAGAHALPGLCSIAGCMWAYGRWRLTGSRWWAVAGWVVLVLGLLFSPQAVLALLYVGLLALLVTRDLRSDLLPLGGLAVISAAYVLNEAIRSDAPTDKRTLGSLGDLLDAMARGALPNVHGIDQLPDSPLTLGLLGLVVALALTALGRRGIEGLVFFVVVFVANGAVTWFGRSEIGTRGATEPRYLTALTLGFWVAVAIAAAPSPRGPLVPLPDLRGRVRPGVLQGVAAVALVVVCAGAAKHYLGRLEASFHNTTFTLQVAHASRGMAERLDRDLGRLAQSGDLKGVVDGELPFPFFYERDARNRVSYLGRAFQDDVEAQGRGPQLFQPQRSGELVPATFTPTTPVARRRCDGRCEIVLKPRASKALTYLRLRADGPVSARATSVSTTLAKNAAPTGTDAAGKPLFRWATGPVTLDPRRPDATLQTWAVDPQEVRVTFTGSGAFTAEAQAGSVAAA
jgi:hypothetical protein